MIDTVVLYLHNTPRNRPVYDACVLNSNQHKEGFIVQSKMGVAVVSPRFVFQTVNYEEHTMNIINGHIRLPTHTYRPYYRIFEDRIKFEFSIPKFLYSTNVLQTINHFGFIKSPYFYLTKSIVHFFETVFSGHTVDYGAVELYRWDFCYNQFYENKETALKVLDYFKHRENMNANTLVFDTGLSQISKSKYFKIYHKGAEYRKNDRKEMTFSNVDIFQRIADKILRYERKCTQKNVAYQFNMKVLYSDAFISQHQYRAAKNNNRRVSKQLRGMFENKRVFTIGKPSDMLIDSYQMRAKFFDSLFLDFHNDIKNRYTLDSLEYDYLENLIDNSDNGRNRQKLHSILMCIEKYGSLRKAYDLNKIGKSTFYRWNAYMKQNGIDSTIRTESLGINQDWGYVLYKNEISKELLDIKKLCNFEYF